MIAAVLKESLPGERRVALIPKDAAALKAKGVDVRVEAGAGAEALHADADYEAVGATVEADRERLLAAADLLLTVRGIGDSEAGRLRPGAAVLGFLDPLDEPERMSRLGAKGVALLAMELVPRITRAQGMDALSSMASIAGYKAVLAAADCAPRMFPMMMTAAGTITPAKVFVLGAGVAGLQAIATARRLGAVVEGYDVRSAVKEQVESLGAKFVELDIDVEKTEGQGGYAAAQSQEFYRKQREALGRHLAGVDLIITTAAVPGKKAPLLITAEMMAGLRPGTVIVDLAAERGGNCAGAVAGEVVRRNGVTILGPVNVPAGVPAHASQMYSRNVANFVDILIRDGALQLDMEDEIVRGALVARGGEVVHERVAELLAAPRTQEA